MCTNGKCVRVKDHKIADETLIERKVKIIFFKEELQCRTQKILRPSWQLPQIACHLALDDSTKLQ
jgi:hypothetical protein